jgi:hypothetical protein
MIRRVAWQVRPGRRPLCAVRDPSRGCTPAR